MDAERERLSTLYNLAVLDSEQEAEFDDIVQLASQICNTPVSLISLVDYDRQWFKANKGFDQTETARNVSFCAHAMLQGEVMQVKDATKDKRFAKNSLVTGAPFIRFYAGAPLITRSGHALGALCVIDQQPRKLSREQVFALKVLGQQVVSKLEMQAKIKSLSALMESKDKILSVISHDIKAPLGNIRQIISLFEQGHISLEELKMLSREILKALDKSDGILNDLIDWFITQKEGEIHQFQELNLATLIRQACTEVSEQLHKKGNTLNLHLDEEVGFPGDANMLKFIFRNLLVNANKFTQNGNISINIIQTLQSIVVKVKDTGIGIEKDRLEKLFTENRNHSTTGTANESGHGLGLLLAQDFAYKHKGKIEIFSEQGIGTEVHVLLPHSKKPMA